MTTIPVAARQKEDWVLLIDPIKDAALETTAQKIAEAAVKKFNESPPQDSAIVYTHYLQGNEQSDEAKLTKKVSVHLKKAEEKNDRLISFVSRGYGSIKIYLWSPTWIKEQNYGCFWSFCWLTMRAQFSPPEKKIPRLYQFLTN